MADIDDLYRDPNAGAYEKEESRTGPPLSYVDEKLANAVQSAHRTYRHIRRDVPDDLPPPRGVTGTSYAVKKDGLLGAAFATFRYALTSFLALNNMLALISDQKRIADLLELDTEDFSNWVQMVEREGSLNG